MFYDKYRQLCDSVGKSPSAVAGEIGISKGTVSTWKNLGRTPQTAQLRKIADYFSVSLDYLLDETDDPYDWDTDPEARQDRAYGPRWDQLMEQHHGDTSAAWKALQAIDEDQANEARMAWRENREKELAQKKKAPAAENCESEKPDWSKMPGATPFNPLQVAPLLGTVRAGYPMYAEENIEGYLPIRQTDGAKYFWLNIRGDSMNAAGMDDGDQILVREQPEVENGQLAVVLVNGDEATVKYFRREGDLVILTPKSFNPAHQPQIYDLKKVPVRVQGLVVECRKVFH